jgi:hypothetical protein
LLPFTIALIRLGYLPLQALLAAHGDLLEQLPIRIPLSAIGPVFGGTASIDLDEEELATGTPEEGTLKVRVLGF